MSKTRATLAAALAVAALAGISAGSASAATTTQLVSGTTLSTLALAATPVVLDSGFSPGQTATNSVAGTVTVTSTGGWTLTASDGSNNGHLQSSAGPACTSGGVTSESQTVNQLHVTSAGTLGGTTGSSNVAISNLGPTIATGTLADTLSQTFSLVLGSTESLLTGCAYTDTITYTAS
jgi:hypothetical protein